MTKLDLGCGKNKKEGFEGVDSIAFEGVDHVVDLSVLPWPWEDGSVDELHSSHVIEHIPARERIAFMNECYRILVPGGKMTLIAPHWASCRAYGDMTHVWPPVSEFWFYYLSKEWRSANCPHDDVEHNPTGYSCDFGATWGYGVNPALQTRNQEFQQFALANYKEAITDLYATLVKK